MAHPLRDRTYARLFAAHVVALTGTGLATVALSLLAYDLAGGDAGRVLGTAFALKMVAYVLGAPVAASLVARLPRRAVMVGADLVRAAVAVCLPLVTEVAQVYVLILLLQLASATFTPAFQAAVAEVLPDEERYTTALSLSRLAYDLEAVLAPALAAALLLVLPAAGLFVGTAIGFGASALLVASAALPRLWPPDGDGRSPRAGARARVRGGLDLFTAVPALRAVLALNLVVACAGAYVLVQTVVIVREVLGLAEGAVGLLLAVNGTGSAAIALAVPRLLRRRSERVLMLGGAVALVLALAVVPAALRLPAPLAAVAVAGAGLAVGGGWSAVATPIGRLVRRHVPAGRLPEAFAAQFSLSHACWLVTYPVAGFVGAVSLTGAAALLAVVAAAATWVAARSWGDVSGVPARADGAGPSVAR